MNAEEQKIRYHWVNLTSKNYYRYCDILYQPILVDLKGLYIYHDEIQEIEKLQYLPIQHNTLHIMQYWVY